MNFKGRVIKDVVAKGSKSERSAVVLDTGKEQYVLRRPGENPYSDPALDDLIGKNISATGNVNGNTLFLSDWSETEK
jgi:hypothetical protein